MAEPILSATWNNHANEVAAVCRNSLENNLLVDCTIAAGGKSLKAHRLILSACSPYFHMLFSEEREIHPVVILTETLFDTLKLVIDFVYCGKVDIPANQFEAFWELVLSLQIKGLNKFSRKDGRTDVGGSDDGKACQRETSGCISMCEVESSGPCHENGSSNSSQQCHFHPLPVCTDSLQTYSSVRCVRRSDSCKMVQSGDAFISLEDHPSAVCNDSEVSVKTEINVKREPLYSENEVLETRNKDLVGVKSDEPVSENFGNGTNFGHGSAFPQDLDKYSCGEELFHVNGNSALVPSLPQASDNFQREQLEQQQQQLQQQVTCMRRVLPSAPRMEQQDPLLPKLLVTKSEETDDADSEEVWKGHDLAGNGSVETDDRTETIFEEIVSPQLNEQIDGSSLLELSESDLREMKLRMGPIKKIMKCLNQVRGEVVVLDVRSVDLVNPDQGNGEVFESEPATAADASPRQPIYVPCNVDIECSRFSRQDSIKEVLRAHSQGEGILRAASEGPFSESDRRCLVRILVSELVSTTGTHYPSDSCKTALAKAIVEEFPLLKDNTSGCLGFEHYFDPNARVGFIEFRLWTMRKGLSPSQKKYSSAAMKRRSSQGPTPVSKRFNNDGLLTQEVMVDKLNWMKHKMPVEANRLAIKSAMQETAVNRRQWIQTEKPSLSDIFEKYPRLLDFEGEMIEQDFHLQWPDHEDNFLMKFPLQYSSNILGYAMRYRPDILSKVKNLPGDDNLKALVTLSALLPVTNSKAKGKVKGKGKQEKNTKEGPASGKASLAEWMGSAAGTSKPSATPEVPNPDLIIILPEGSNLPLEELERRKSSQDKCSAIYNMGERRKKRFLFCSG